MASPTPQEEEGLGPLLPAQRPESSPQPQQRHPLGIWWANKMDRNKGSGATMLGNLQPCLPESLRVHGKPPHRETGVPRGCGEDFLGTFRLGLKNSTLFVDLNVH